MRRAVFSLFVAACLLTCTLAHATIFGRIQGIVHDPQHRPVAGASVKLQAITSDWSQTTQTDDNGEFLFTVRARGRLQDHRYATQIRHSRADRYGGLRTRHPFFTFN